MSIDKGISMETASPKPFAPWLPVHTRAGPPTSIINADDGRKGNSHIGKHCNEDRIKHRLWQIAAWFNSFITGPGNELKALESDICESCCGQEPATPLGKNRFIINGSAWTGNSYALWYMNITHGNSTTISDWRWPVSSSPGPCQRVPL